MLDDRVQTHAKGARSPFFELSAEWNVYCTSIIYFEFQTYGLLNLQKHVFIEKWHIRSFRYAFSSSILSSSSSSDTSIKSLTQLCMKTYWSCNNENLLKNNLKYKTRYFVYRFNTSTFSGLTLAWYATIKLKYR